MKIVLFSDVHANLPAFERALEEIEKQKPDAIYCLGDLVGYNVFPNEVINEIRKRHIPTIAGNHDAKVKNLTEKQLAETGKNYAYSIIGASEKEYLATLPAHIQIDFQFNEDSLKMLLVHGSPKSNEEYLLEDKDENDFINVFKDADVDILCFGHSHKPYYRILSETVGNTTKYYHAINTGSVGKPKDGNAQGGFVVLHIHKNSGNLYKESLQVQFIRFHYDIDLSVKAIEASPLPNEFAEMLKKAF
ncbi:metallophosphoesterase [Arcicella rosea]|uniref:Putative phosphoesterase n=1 Tax=Arcicella rosea TaxID=502909 RepID=A0A841EK95_9BACT|nr:metallophosphoesterase family protein [Arcicella rosea]MBB6002624.1 putative phosphoesterase [Arcicella rosea]